LCSLSANVTRRVTGVKPDALTATIYSPDASLERRKRAVLAFSGLKMSIGPLLIGFPWITLPFLSSVVTEIVSASSSSRRLLSTTRVTVTSISAFSFGGGVGSSVGGGVTSTG